MCRLWLTWPGIIFLRTSFERTSFPCTTTNSVVDSSTSIWCQTLGLGLRVGLFLLKLPVFPPALLGRAIGPLLLEALDDKLPALVAIGQDVETVGQQLAGDLAVLLAGSRRLGLDYDARRYVFQLHC